MTGSQPVPLNTSLAGRIEAALRLRGSTADAERIAHAAEVARLVLAWGTVDLEHADEVVARGIVARLSGLGDEEAAVVIALAAAPDVRPVSPEGQLAFGARFGRAAGRRLAERETADVDLEGYADRRGPVAAVQLLDGMIELSARDGQIRADEHSRLEAAAASLAVETALTCFCHRRHAPDVADRGQAVALPAERMSIGRAPGSGLLLVDPQVAPHHADLVRTDDGFRIVDARSGRTTVVSGRPVRSAPVTADDSVVIGPYTLRIDPRAGVLRVTTGRRLSRLVVHGVSRRIGELALLDNVEFTVLSGEVVVVVGPSGCGKTTLLDAISGAAPADRGAVELDGRDFHDLLAADPSRVGSVPQDDIVHPELTVGESLTFGARLRLSPDGARLGPDHGEVVDRVLGELSIGAIRASRIGDALRRGISGGQRKRVNLGQELLSSTTDVLFLDEPLSGLDPRAAQDIVRLVRQLADRGRMVFLVSHDLSPLVMAQVDHLLVLVPGGRVGWFGPPDAACRYFGVDTPDAIFDVLGGRPPEAWAEAWRESRAFRQFVRSREALALLSPPGPAPAPQRRPSGLRQLAVLTSRYLRVKARDRTGLTVLLCQPPFLALVMAVVFPAPTGPLLFMLTLACLWFGMSAAVRELIADRAVARRERRVGVGVGAQVGSKVAVLSLLAVLQCAFLAGTTWVTFALADYGWPLLPLLGVASLIGVVGMALGLLVSALLSSTEGAVGTLLLLLIPQISLSGLLVELRDLSPVARALSWANPLRYAFEAMLKVGEKVAAPERVPGKYRAQSYTGALYDYGFKGPDADDLGLPFWALIGALAAFAAALLVATWLAARRKT